MWVTEQLKEYSLVGGTNFEETSEGANHVFVRLPNNSLESLSVTRSTKHRQATHVRQVLHNALHVRLKCTRLLQLCYEKRGVVYITSVRVRMRARSLLLRRSTHMASCMRQPTSLRPITRTPTFARRPGLKLFRVSVC